MTSESGAAPEAPRIGLYGVFNPRGELVALFRDFKVADAYVSYDRQQLGEAAYWSLAPQPATIKRVMIETPEPPEDRHTLRDEPITHCSCFDCPRHKEHF